MKTLVLALALLVSAALARADDHHITCAYPEDFQGDRECADAGCAYDQIESAPAWVEPNIFAFADTSTHANHRVLWKYCTFDNQPVPPPVQ